MITIVSFMFGLHALQKMDAFGLDRKEIETMITKGMKWKEEKEEKWHALMNNFEVVFKRSNDTIFIITVYPEERRK